MRTIAIVILAVLVCASGAWAGGVGNAVEVSILTDNGRTLPTYPVTMSRGVCKVYTEAIQGDGYRIEVRNRLNRRIGLVIAVDGRNIISGKKSWLKRDERMYILEPYASGEFAGWRTAQDRIQRFYFTDMADSYAAAFGDESAMGVIAVAVYPEMRRCSSNPISRPGPSGPRNNDGASADSAGPAGAAPSAREDSAKGKREQKSRPEQALESAGTGYGRAEYSPSHIVDFEPERRAIETICFKYEWRSTLCQLGIIECGKPPCRPPNRLWDNGGYAPPPPSGMRACRP